MPALLLALVLTPAPAPVRAVPAADFLNSIGVNSAVAVRGERLETTIASARYLGVRWFRVGNESGIAVPDLVRLHRATGARIGWGLGSGGTDLAGLLRGGRELAASGALLAFEGANEPNNWGITYGGETGGRDGSWRPVAALQRDLYASVHRDGLLRRYPVWSISEGGAEVDNVGLQFLTVPKGAGTEVPDGTRYADAANVHNYVYHPNSPGLEDNKTWNAADPTSACKVDGLYGEYGRTWGKRYRGYSERDLLTLPRVTTETGAKIEGPVTERVHALDLMNLYLAQFARGWSHTAVYLLRDRVDEAGNQRYGFYTPEGTPRLAAVYLHNLTTILADRGPAAKPRRLPYAIPNRPPTVHDLLLQKSDGTLALVVWSERVTGGDEITIDLGATFPKLSLYDPTFGTTAIETRTKARTLRLTLTDHSVVVEIPKAGKVAEGKRGM